MIPTEVLSVFVIILDMNKEIQRISLYRQKNPYLLEAREVATAEEMTLLGHWMRTCHKVCDIVFFHLTHYIFANVI